MRKTSKRRVGVADIDVYTRHIDSEASKQLDNAVDALIAALKYGEEGEPPPGWVTCEDIASRMGTTPDNLYKRLWKRRVPIKRYLRRGKWMSYFDVRAALACITKAQK